MEFIDKIVEFDKYCNKCKYKDADTNVDPCNECLSNPVNTYSRKPVKFVEEEVKKK